MQEENSRKLFFPFFYNYYEITESMSDAELGRLVRIVALNLRGDKVEVPREFQVIYNFIVDDANRIFNRRCSGKSGKRRLADFDTEEVFHRALERSYGKER